jgi:hypothetical protein
MAFESSEGLVKFDHWVDEIKTGRLPSRCGGRMTDHKKQRIAGHRPTEREALRRLDKAERHGGTPKRRKPKRRRRGKRGGK